MVPKKNCVSVVYGRSFRLLRWLLILWIGSLGWSVVLAQPLTPRASQSNAAESAVDTSPPPAFFAGYDRGFVIANHGQDEVSPDGFPFLMRVNSWVQLRNTIFDSQGLHSTVRSSGLLAFGLSCA